MSLETATSRFEISQPYTELTLTAESTIALSGADPFAFTRAPIRPSFPLVWMPWEHMMLFPYLAPSNYRKRNCANSTTTPCRSWNTITAT